MREWRELVKESLEEFNINYLDAQLEQAAGYLKMVWEDGRKLNLTGASSREELLEKHLLDSLVLLHYYTLMEQVWCDLGPGGGFPGIPLKIFSPSGELYVLEASRKKINFIKRAVRKLRMEGIYYLHGRAENFGNNIGWRESFRIITVRAVAEIPVLLEIGLPLLKKSGKMLLYKGPRGEEELKSSGEALRLCGGEVVGIKTYKLPGGERRKIIEVEKTGDTPVRYPRGPGIPEKNPLK